MVKCKFLKTSLLAALLSSAGGCSSGLVAYVYRGACLTPEVLLNDIQEQGFLFYKDVNEPYQVCGEKYDKYRVVRSDVTLSHLDGRSFQLDEVSQVFYVAFDREKCQLALVAPFTGPTDDIKDAKHILSTYFVNPLLKKLQEKKTMADAKLTITKAFDSESQFKKVCSEI